MVMGDIVQLCLTWRMQDQEPFSEFFHRLIHQVKENSDQIGNKSVQWMKPI